MRPLVSILTPTGNREHFLPLIARCVLRQQVAWEWLVFDDSPQPSAFMQCLASSDARIRYWHVNVRMPTGAKRMHMLREVRGSIIAHFDDDDHYAPGYLAGMTGVLEQQGADLVKLSAFYVYAPRVAFFGYMDLVLQAGPHYLLSGEAPQLVEFDDSTRPGNDFVLFYGFSYVYKRELTDVAGFDPIDLFEDHSFIARVMAAQSKVVAIADDKQWCLHLIHPAATSRCFSRYMIPSFLLPRLFEAFEGYPERPC